MDIDHAIQSGAVVRIGDLMAACNKPDGYLRTTDSVLTLIYYITQNSPNDTVAYVTIMGGQLRTISYNESTANDNSRFHKWDDDLAGGGDW